MCSPHTAALQRAGAEHAGRGRMGPKFFYERVSCRHPHASWTFCSIPTLKGGDALAEGGGEGLPPASHSAGAQRTREAAQYQGLGRSLPLRGAHQEARKHTPQKPGWLQSSSTPAQCPTPRQQHRPHGQGQAPCNPLPMRAAMTRALVLELPGENEKCQLPVSSYQPGSAAGLTGAPLGVGSEVLGTDNTGCPL